MPLFILLTIFLRKCEFTFLGLYTDRRKMRATVNPQLQHKLTDSFKKPIIRL